MLWAAGGYLALLLAGGLALRAMWRRRGDVPALWRNRARWLRQSPWRGRDLLYTLSPILLLLLPAGARSPAPAWRLIMLHGMGLLTAALLWRRIRHAHGGGRARMPMGRAGIRHWTRRANMRLRQAGFFYLAALPVILLAGMLNHLVVVLAGHTPVLQEAALELMRLPDWRARLPLIIAAALTAPAYEELVFRGMALPLAARAGGGAPAILVTAAVFAMIHWHAGALLPLFVLAIFLAIAYIYTRSLTTVIIMHAVFNFINIALLCLIANAGNPP